MDSIAEVKILGNYGHGFEEVTCETTYKEARLRLAEYREAEPGIHFRIRAITWQQVRAYARRLYVKLRETERGYCPGDSARNALSKAGEHFNLGYGVESFSRPGGDHGIVYLNTGETYATTVYYRCGSERFYVGSWGDVVEHAPASRYA